MVITVNNIMVKVEGLSKEFRGEMILQDVNITLERGKIYGLVGMNGSGKTVFMKCLCGFLKPTTGKVTVDGKEVGKEIDFPQDLGLMIETPGFIPYMSGKSNLKNLALIRNQIGNYEIEEALRSVGLDPNLKKHVSKYSLGMRQRLGIAQALLADPKLLICDEPTSALDPVGRKEILDILYKIRGTTTVLFSTHILSDVERICDHVALLNDGNIAVGGTLSEIKALHSHDSLLIEFSTEADLQHFKECMTGQSLLNGSEEKGREIVIHSREMKKAQHTIFSTLAEADIAPIKVELMEPSLESLFLEVIK